ncbi:MAG: hypothetical protein GC191_03700 [Azospirillum sp.]|nr:hypothetical protein [Azospirillum sp.]
MAHALAFFDWVTSHLGALVTLAFAVAGLLAQTAALFDLAGLARLSTTLHDAVQVVAGNWGKAANLVRVIRTYRAEGSAAALTELENLAAAHQYGTGSGDARNDRDGGLPPGAAPAAAVLAAMLGVGSVAGCAPLSAGLDHATGSTLAERCRVYRLGAVMGNALTSAFPENAGLAALDQAAVRALCDSLPEVSAP